MIDSDLVLLTPEQVCDILGVEMGTLYQWHTRRIGPQPIKVGRLLRYRRVEVERYIREAIETRDGEAEKVTA